MVHTLSKLVLVLHNSITAKLWNKFSRKKFEKKCSTLAYHTTPNAPYPIGLSGCGSAACSPLAVVDEDDDDDRPEPA